VGLGHLRVAGLHGGGLLGGYLAGGEVRGVLGQVGRHPPAHGQLVFFILFHRNAG